MEATLTSSTRSEPETVEAMITSGPRRGETITLDAQTLEAARDPQLTPEEEAALDRAIEAARQAADSATSVSDKTRALREAFDEAIADFKREKENAHGLHGQSR